MIEKTTALNVSSEHEPRHAGSCQILKEGKTILALTQRDNDRWMRIDG
jgi:hypothetical protein